LRVGGVLQVGRVSLTLILAPAWVGAADEEEDAAESATEPAWGGPGAPSAVAPPAPAVPLPAPGPAAPFLPLPPSAVPPVRSPVVAEPRPQPAADPLDLSGCPEPARSLLMEGAQGARLAAGAPAAAWRTGSWVPGGEPLAARAVLRAVDEARRVLGQETGTTAAHGHVGDVALEFTTPPLALAPVLVAWVDPRRPAPLDAALLRRVAGLLMAGRSILLAAPWPAPALAAVASRLPDRWPITALPAGEDSWWVPDGRPVLDPAHRPVVAQALAHGITLIEDPSPPTLTELLARAAHGHGGLLLGLVADGAWRALELLRTVWPVPEGRAAATKGPGPDEPAAAAVARAFPYLLAAPGTAGEADDAAWTLSEVQAEGPGWRILPLVRGPEPAR
ncbi:MAG TPA: hypothetical protein VMW49_03890, partial [Candidatus Dormibacteraeota bacterium]|nr:hypothetical protein [Candidatus Dormibacteraeota bacterium]